MTGAPADDSSGARLADQIRQRVTRANVIAHAMGALVTFFAVGFLAPLSIANEETFSIALRNAVAVSIYVAVVLAVLVRVGTRRAQPIERFLRSGRPPNDTDRQVLLSQPVFAARLAGLGWGGGAVLGTIFNLPVSLGFAGIVFGTAVCGGLTTTALTYLLSERIYRPAFALALQDVAPKQPTGPSVALRLTTTWALASGVPLLGVLVISVDALAGGDLKLSDVAGAALFLGLVSAVVGAVGIVVSARSVADPVAAVSAAVADVEQGRFDARVDVDDASEVGLLQAGFNRMAAGLEERERVRDLFGRHVGREVAQAALDSEIELGGEVRDVAVLFVDVVGSTTIAARRPPEEVVELLNRFFALVVEAAEEQGGWINKFEGDAALCVFGAPVPMEDAAARALAAARELRRRLTEELPEMDAGIGVSAGPAVAGHVGAEERFEYTVIGDPVNEASRLCELAKDKGERVVASQRALDEAGPEEREHWSLGESVTLRGRDEPTRLAVAS